MNAMMSKSKVLSQPGRIGLASSSLVRKCLFHTTVLAKKMPGPSGPFNQPISGADVPRSGGIASMMRLPIQKTTEGWICKLFALDFIHGATTRQYVGTQTTRQTESSIVQKFYCIVSPPHWNSFSLPAEVRT